jgi:hypothetical protein
MQYGRPTRGARLPHAEGRLAECDRIFADHEDTLARRDHPCHRRDARPVPPSKRDLAVADLPQQWMSTVTARKTSAMRRPIGRCRSCRLTGRPWLGSSRPFDVVVDYHAVVVRRGVMMRPAMPRPHPQFGRHPIVRITETRRCDALFGADIRWLAGLPLGLVMHGGNSGRSHAAGPAGPSARLGNRPTPRPCTGCPSGTH